MVRRKLEKGDSCRIDSLDMPLETLTKGKSSDALVEREHNKLITRAFAQGDPVPTNGLSQGDLATLQTGLQRVHSKLNALVLSDEDLRSALHDSFDEVETKDD